MAARNIDYYKRWRESESIYQFLDIKDQKDILILEIGIGVGHLSHYLLAQGHQVISVDMKLDFGKEDGRPTADILKIAHDLLDPCPQTKLFEFKGNNNAGDIEFEKLKSYLPPNKKIDLTIFKSASIHEEGSGDGGIGYRFQENDYQYFVDKIFELSNPGSRFILGLYPEFSNCDHNGYGNKLFYDNRITNPDEEKLFGKIAMQFYK